MNYFLKKRQTRLLSLLLVLCMVMTLFACNNNNSTGGGETGGDEIPEEQRYGGVPQRVAPQRSMRVSPRSRTVMYSLHSLEDCCEVIDQLIANNTVVLTMDELDGHLLQRAVDTLSGAVFALHASIRKASDRTYLVAPMSVEINDTFDMDRRF